MNEELQRMATSQGESIQVTKPQVQEEIPLEVLDMVCGGMEDSRFGAGSWSMSFN